ncbi:hypothetical protein [Brachyspira hyodysenteriae]|uniref:hypothetical protein n=1 Tax=Brachyspira hyodysenteriae TaxID=159 RepID=UPI0022CDB8DA|nr:hypothetical protein [Brachyspira hyodysenteriae]MCZ9926757.1 hypothetical protein [Brachyspira hyodysenteriae]MCZ9928427.1 hypothetical protein [Brachyspira hyodysenteriae]
MQKLKPFSKEERNTGITLRVTKATFEEMKKEANSLNMRVSEYLVELHKMYINEVNKK